MNYLKHAFVAVALVANIAAAGDMASQIFETGDENLCVLPAVRFAEAVTSNSRNILLIAFGAQVVTAPGVLVGRGAGGMACGIAKAFGY